MKVKEFKRTMDDRKEKRATLIRRIGINIRKWRETNDVSQTDLSFAASLKSGQLSRIEMGLSPSLSVALLSEIAEAMDVRLERGKGARSRAGVRNPKGKRRITGILHYSRQIENDKSLDISQTKGASLNLSGEIKEGK